MDITIQNLCKDVFQSKGSNFYPSFTTFINDIRDIKKKTLSKKELQSWMKENFPHIELWYNSQEIVQVFSKQPDIMALQKKKGFYPKIISFYPFERLYVDTAFINLFDTTRQGPKKPSVAEPIIEPIAEPIAEPKPTDKPTYNGKYPEYIGVRDTKKGMNKWVYYINKNKARKLGLKFQDYVGTISHLENLIDKQLQK